MEATSALRTLMLLATVYQEEDASKTSPSIHQAISDSSKRSTSRKLKQSDLSTKEVQQGKSAKTTKVAKSAMGNNNSRTQSRHGHKR